MSKLFTVFSFELKEFAKRKSTIIMMLIYIIIAFGITFIPNIGSGNGAAAKLFSSDTNPNFTKSAYLIKDQNIKFDKGALKEAKEYQDKSKLEEDIKNEKIKEAVVIEKDKWQYLSKSASLINGENEYKKVFEYQLKNYYFSQKGLNYNDIKTIENNMPKIEEISVDSGSLEKRAFMSGFIYAGSFIMYMTVIMFGSILATNVAREKTNRAMELLIVTVKPKILIVGKVLAYSSVAIMEILLIILSLLVGLKINAKNYAEGLKMMLYTIDTKILLVWLIFSLTGFIMLMFLFASCASLVSKIEEINTVISLPMIIFIIAFFLNITVINNPGKSKLSEILSLFPLTSYFVMPTRFAIIDINFAELIISYLILLIATVIIAFISIRVFRNATLHYGKKSSFFKLIRKK